MLTYAWLSLMTCAAFKMIPGILLPSSGEKSVLPLVRLPPQERKMGLPAKGLFPESVRARAHDAGPYGVSLTGLRKRNIASLIVSPSKSMVSRSIPKPKPPWGGHPYLKNSR